MNKIICDNPACNFKCEVERKDVKEFVNKRCPRCGTILLTKAEYFIVRFMWIVEKINLNFPRFKKRKIVSTYVRIRIR